MGKVALVQVGVAYSTCVAREGVVDAPRPHGDAEGELLKERLCNGAEACTIGQTMGGLMGGAPWPLDTCGAAPKMHAQYHQYSSGSKSSSPADRLIPDMTNLKTARL